MPTRNEENPQFYRQWTVQDFQNDRLGGDHSTGPRQRTGIVAEGGPWEWIAY